MAPKQTLTRLSNRNPTNQAYYARADLKSWTEENNHIEQMKDLLLSGVTNWRGEISLRFAVAKECEDIGRYAEQFRFIKSACDLQRRHTRYDVSDDIEALGRITTYTQKTLGQNRPGKRTAEPIFVRGARTAPSLVTGSSESQQVIQDRRTEQASARPVRLIQVKIRSTK